MAIVVCDIYVLLSRASLHTLYNLFTARHTHNIPGIANITRTTLGNNTQYTTDTADNEDKAVTDTGYTADKINTGDTGDITDTADTGDNQDSTHTENTGDTEDTRDKECKDDHGDFYKDTK